MNWNAVLAWQKAYLSATDVAQIVILYLAFYGILKAARGSRFGQVLTGVGLLFGVLAAFTFLFHFEVLSRIVYYLLLYLAISSVVIFQPEIRRILATIGSLLFKDRRRDLTPQDRLTPEKLADCVLHLACQPGSGRAMGALLAIERGISLRSYETSGVPLDALVTEELLVSIFTEPLPLHDGGVIIRDGRLSSAHCIFPVSGRQDIFASGMRHRAALGLSEDTDAFVIVVSEETGRISVAHNGHIRRLTGTAEANRAELMRWLSKAMVEKKTGLELVADWISRRLPARLKSTETAA